MFNRNPAVVMIQDAKITGLSVKKLKDFSHRVLPEYALFTRTSLKGKRDEVRVVTFVHHALAARGTQIDISKMIVPNAACQLTELAARVQVIKTSDVHTDVQVLWINIYNFLATQHAEQQALLDLVGQIVSEWGPKVGHVIIGGDWNASLSPRLGYAQSTETSRADQRLKSWLHASATLGLVALEPAEPTWLSPAQDHEAVLDRFVVRTVGSPVCRVTPSEHVVYDHMSVSVTLDGSVVSPLPTRWDIIKPRRLKMQLWPERRAQWASLLSAKIAGLGDGGDPVSLADSAQALAVKTAHQVLGTSGGKRASLIPFHSTAYKKLVAVIRVTKAARMDIHKRLCNTGPARPSKAMRAAWDRGILPGTKVPYSHLSDVWATANAPWTKEWLGLLVERFQSFSRELRSVRHQEIRVATEQAMEARIARMARGGSGEIQRLLGKRCPVVSPPYVATTYPDQVLITCLSESLLLQAAIFSCAPTATLAVESDAGAAHTLRVSQIPCGRLAAILGAAEGHKVSLANTKVQYVQEPSDRLTAWESHLACEAAASHTRCSVCKQQDTVPVSSTTPVRQIRFFCSDCCAFVCRKVDAADYEDLPFPTDSIPKVAADANETLSGEISLDDLKFRISQLPRGKSAGDDGMLYELLKEGPEKLIQIIHAALNSLLTKKMSVPQLWKGGLIKLLFKKGDPMMCKNFRPVVLLRVCYKLYTSILTDRLYGISERHGLLHSSQEGFRRYRSCSRQAQSLFWAYQEAKRLHKPLVVAFLDFANAFNSVDHPALWKWLRTIGVPDVDMIEALYTDSYYQADTPFGTSAKVFLTRGTKQGDGLSPLLFSLIFNYLLVALEATGLGHKSASGLSTPSRAFADDVALAANCVQSMNSLLIVVDKFCAWSGMQLNVAKSEISAWDFGTKLTPDISQVRVNGQTLQCLPATQAFRYLGFRFSLMGKWGEEVAHIFTATRELLPVVNKHGYTVGQMTQVINSVVTSRFRYSAAMVPWSDRQLDQLHGLWIRLQKGAWRLPCSYPGALFKFPEERGGMPVAHPKVYLLQALVLHIEQLALQDDDILKCARVQYQRLCQVLGCHSQDELRAALLEIKRVKNVPDCPMARLVRLSGELGMQARLPALITGSDIPHLSWFQLKCRVKQGMSADTVCSDAERESGQLAIAGWMQAVAKLKLATPSHMHWKLEAGSRKPVWVTPNFRVGKLSHHFSNAIRLWGNPTAQELRKQLLGSRETLNSVTGLQLLQQQQHTRGPVELLTRVLDSTLVTIIVSDVTESSETSGPYHLYTAQSMTRVDTCESHVCTLPQARLGFLREHNQDCLCYLKEWVRLAQKAETARSCLSMQAQHYLQDATGANLLIGSSPMSASSAFASSWTNTLDRAGWTCRSGEQLIPLVNMLNMPEGPQILALDWISKHTAISWFVLTRQRTCPVATRRMLGRLGSVVCRIKRGQKLLARVGSWSTGDMRTANSGEDWLLWMPRATDCDAKEVMKQRIGRFHLTASGKVPFVKTGCTMREAAHGPAGPYYRLAGTVAATDGSVRADGCMGCGVVYLQDRPTVRLAVLGAPSSSRAELSGLIEAAEDAPLYVALCILTDSLTSLQNLTSMCRSDFCRDIRRHPQRDLLVRLVEALNKRSNAGSSTLLVKIRAHKGEPLNEAADEAADTAVDNEVPQETLALDPARCYFVIDTSLKTVAWDPRLRKSLADKLSRMQYVNLNKRFYSLDSPPPTSIPPKKAMTRAETFLSRQTCGRHLLGKALCLLPKREPTRRILQALGNTFPVRSKLAQWGLAQQPDCLLCRAKVETLCHTQCLCPALAPARILAHHHCWNTVFSLLAGSAGKGWVLRQEMTVSGMAAMKAPAAMPGQNMEWGRLAAILDDESIAVEDECEQAARSYVKLIDAIQSAGSDADKMTQILLSDDLRELIHVGDASWISSTASDPQELMDELQVGLDWVRSQPSSHSAGPIGRKRPDGFAVNWGQRKLLLLEFTRCHDSERLSLRLSDEYKHRKYSPLLERMLQRLGPRWTGSTLSFTAGTRGSVCTEIWTSHMTMLGLPERMQTKTLQASVLAALESLNIVFAARKAALAGLHAH
jgi:ribonuclease HI